MSDEKCRVVALIKTRRTVTQEQAEEVKRRFLLGEPLPKGWQIYER